MIPMLFLPDMPAATTLADTLPFFAQIQPVFDALPEVVSPKRVMRS
jgi:hypothetical protein